MRDLCDLSEALNDRYTDIQMYQQKIPCVLVDTIPLDGAAAAALFQPTKEHQNRARK